MEEKLTVKKKMGYGFSELGTMATEMLIRLYLLIFYTDLVGLRPQLAGYAVAIAIVWDAVTDPLMGVISDGTKTRWGRRRPYILFGAFFLGITLVMLFSEPPLSGQTGKFLYLLVSYILLNTAMTVVTVPHFALGREVTFNPNERTEVFGWRLLFGNIGFLAGTILPGIFLISLGQNSDMQAGITAHQRAAVIVGLLIVIGSSVTFFSMRGLDKTTAPYSFTGVTSFLSFMSSAFSNMAFLPLFLAYCTAMIGLSLYSSLALYYYRYRLKLAEQNIQIILIVFILIFSLSLLFWVFITRKYGKKRPAFWASLFLGLATTIVYPLLPEGKTVPVLFIAATCGFLVGSIVIIESLVADTVDYDELICGNNREGLYSGFWKMGTKMSRAVALAITGHLLHLIGYMPNQIQSPEVEWRLALMFGPGVGFFITTGALIFLFMPLTNEKHTRIQRLLLMKQNRKSKAGKKCT